MKLVCESSGNCSHEWVYIGPEGDTSQCGRSGDYGVLSYGRIQDLSLEKILGDKQRNQIRRRQAVLPQTECKDCRFWGMCHGGCPLDAFMVYGDFNRRTPNCDVLRIFIEKYFEPITGLRADFRPQN
jgi:radical SAM protein with 4Fe4S-binding SPASM domain